MKVEQDQATIIKSKIVKSKEVKLENAQDYDNKEPAPTEDLRDYGNTQYHDEMSKELVPTMDYKQEWDRLWKENHKQDTIIKALVFYIQEAKQ
jgi:hypothetical protein